VSEEERDANFFTSSGSLFSTPELIDALIRESRQDGNLDAMREYGKTEEHSLVEFLQVT
jgi:hypothetical protein